MRFVFAFCFLPSLLSCTLYQSEGRVALEKDKNGIITASGLNLSSSIEYICYKSALAPFELNGPLHVIETSFESQGFSSYLVNEDPGSKYVLVYEALREETEADQHRFCRAKFLQPSSKSLIEEAIDLVVFQLLDPEARP